MLRDFRFFRRNNNDVDEIENVPINPSDSALNPSLDSSRAPLHAIPEPPQNPNPNFEQEVSTKIKLDRSPRGKSTETSTLPTLRTPERQGGNGNSGRNRFGFEIIPNSLGLSSRNGGSLNLNLTPGVNGGPGIGRSNSVHSECTSTQSTPTKSVSKPPNPGFATWSSSRHQGSARAGNYTAPSRRFSVSGNQPSVVSTVEVPHFDLKEDPSFWMDHNVQVLLRVRPLSAIERTTNGYIRCVRQESAQSITWIGQPETRFTFDHVACETVDQEMLFRMAGLPMVENCLSGYNSCMFAYGQTGSGKTYTMLGEMDDLEFKPSPHRGMTPRIFEFLFARIRAEEESRKDESLKYCCKCSFLEIHNEQITDLLDPSSTNLLLREDVKKGVYVENLSEFEVHTVGDMLRLLVQGSSNRKVAATKMNRESSRSHSVFTCIIESKWERNSTTNLRFARLNLVDLAGSERQKSSGAEGERLKEAANINKSLSTLGHVIMLLVDIAHGKPKHVPYRDSRLTFLLQDSLGGNAKTTIIANISPAVCCAAETLNTLKFAQRAKLIQNNAVVNEDSAGDVAALHHQIWLLNEELSALKRQNVSRTLAFDPSTTRLDQENIDAEICLDDDLHGSEWKGNMRVSSKQLKSLETMLAGALRREQMGEATIKQVEAEIEQLNRLVSQREEDNRCTKMMLKFREDKIRRMESLLGDLKPVDAYLLEENASLSEENQLLRAKLDKNPEVTRFAYENIRLLDQLRRYQDFYEEGERDILMREVSELRSQLVHLLDNSSQQHSHAKLDQDATNNIEDKEYLHSKLTNTLDELDECQSKLKSCLESNAKLSREIEDLQAMLRNKELETYERPTIFNTVKEAEVSFPGAQAFDAEDILNLEVELDILKIILKEERLSRAQIEESAKRDLKESKSIIEALESQQLLTIQEIDDLKDQNSHCLELLNKQDFEICVLKEQSRRQETVHSCSNSSKPEGSPLQAQLTRMQASLDKAKGLNRWYQNNDISQKSNEEERDEIRRQAEAETAEVIVSLQEELSMLQHQVQENSDMKSQDNEALRQMILEKDMEIKSLTEDWELLSYEIEETLLEGLNSLRSASDQLDSISTPISDKRGWISEQWSKMVRQISDKETTIKELNVCLKDANSRVNDMEYMLMSLKAATMAMTESHQQECYVKEREVLQLRSEMRKLSVCSTAAFVIIGRLSEIRSSHMETLRLMDNELTELQEVNKKKEVFIGQQTIAFEEAQTLIEELGKEMEKQRSHILMMQKKFDENEEYAISKTQERLNDLKIGVSEVRRSMSLYPGQDEYREKNDPRTLSDDVIDGERAPLQMSNKIKKEKSKTFSSFVEELEAAVPSSTVKGENMCMIRSTKEYTLNLLRMELECAMQSLKEVQAEMVCISTEKAELLKSEKKSREGMETVKAQVLCLEAVLSDFETQCEDKILALDLKLHNVESGAREARSFWRKTKESLVFELEDAKATSAQKIVEASRFLARFGEAQDTMKEADMMINELMIANETSKLEIEELRIMNENLIDEVQELQSSIDLKDQRFKTLEDQFKLDVSEITSLIEGLEMTMSLTQNATEDAFMFMVRDFNCIKSQLQDALKFVHSSLEDVWSEILLKECAMSVLHLCHTGALHDGVCESNAIISNLRERNMKSEEELEICRTVKGKLLSDIKNNFGRISSKEGETRELSIKLSRFEEKLEGLAGQEELMLEKSNIMGSELAMLMNELNQSNSKMTESLSENEKVIQSQAENFEMEFYTKDLVMLILASEMQQLADYNSEMTKKQNIYCSDLDHLMWDMITLRITADFGEKLVEESKNDAKEREAEFLKELQTLKSENGTLLKDFLAKDNELDSSMSLITMLKLQNCELEENISSLASRIVFLEKEAEMKKAEFEEFQCSQLSTTEALCKKSRDLESHSVKLTMLQKENLALRNELQYLEEKVSKALTASTSKVAKCIGSVLDKMSQDTSLNHEILSNFSKKMEFLESMAEGLVTENISLQEELIRKDEVLNGLLFDLRLLQESGANAKDQKDEIEELAASLEFTEDELELRSRELDETVIYSQTLEATVKEQGDIILSLETDLEKANQSTKMLSDKNMELCSYSEELIEKKGVIDSLENEILEMGNTLGHMIEVVESLKNNLGQVSGERDHLQNEIVLLEEKVESSLALAEENEAIAAEAKEIAESQRLYADEKEEEVKLLEKSVQELDSTVTVLEDKVEILKEEAERQRLQREELELEVHALKNKMYSVESADGDVKRHLEEKARNLEEALKRMKVLEKDLATKDTEIAQCKAHIVELTIHAEAQASEYKNKFKGLEAMVEQVKAEEASNHERLSANKLEKNASKGRGSASPFKAKGSGSPFKPRGSGSPFKCIGLGLSHQLRSEKDEDLTAERLRIEELEALAATRQKEIFMLNSRLATAESMTHDVIRDLLGVKLDMSSYVTLLDNQQGHKITEKAQFDCFEPQDHEVKELKKQLNQFIEERQGWLEEIGRRQTELVGAQIALEKRCEQEELLSTENEALKMELSNHKRRVTELEGELNKLSGQQNFHHRIHHHAKIKEENNVLKIQIEELISRLRRAESYISRIKEELSHYRSCSGKSPHINFDEEQRLSHQLQETEREKLHLGQTLLGLCTSILKVAGITRKTSEIDLFTAEKALKKLGNRVISLQREVDDLKLQNKIAGERMRLAELTPSDSRSEENRQTPRRSCQAPFFSALDR